MQGPDYQKYSLDELYEAISCIDELKFPERTKRLRDEISKRESLKRPRLIEKNKENINHRLAYFILVKKLNKASIVLKIISFLFGSALFINYFLGFSLDMFGYKFILSFPEMGSFEKDELIFLFNLVVITINALFVISSVGSYLRINFFQMLLAIAWGIMSIGLEFWEFQWWPTLNSDLPVSLKFELFNLKIGMKLNLLSLAFFFWTLLISPELRKELISK